MMLQYIDNVDCCRGEIMADLFNYSVAIRTLWTNPEKYSKLIRSIMNQNVLPEKIVVMLPYGNNTPEKIAGIEEFRYCSKGMISQRSEALKYIESEYVLFCDDDLEFEKDFVDKLSKPLLLGKYGCSTGPLLDLFPKNSIKYKFVSILGGSCVMLRGKKSNYVRILKTGGWSYNRYIDTSSCKYYDTDSFAGAVFLLRTSDMKKIRYTDELWAENTGYAAFEDRILSYKLTINGIKSCVVSNAKYTHNDGKSSINNLKLEPIYAATFNHYVFWHRFIYSVQNNCLTKLWSKICVEYYMFMNRLYYTGKAIMNRKNTKALKVVVSAEKDARKFTKSNEYFALKDVITNN